MDKCKRCSSSRVANVGAKCSDMFNATIGLNEYDGYVPCDMGIGGGDYVEFSYCLDCGQIQKTFPLPETAIETDKAED